ncbi:MarC family protein [Methyloligella solikamskensis]|uniref:UPF0056 membrane protein n=1 Tax=Methyloligella solikamskensis TaxID=1177756 RepID=A0ABW3JDF0_9HYPH
MLLATLTPDFSEQERRWIAIRAVLIGTIILLGFVVVGNPVLRALGVSLAALQTAGGIILLAIGLRMVLSSTNGHRLSASENAEACAKSDDRSEIAVFPLAMPIIAGPGAMTSAIVLTASRHEFTDHMAVMVAVVAVMAVTLALLLAAEKIQDFLGVIARKVLVRIFDILLAALAMQSIFNGPGEAHLFR